MRDFIASSIVFRLWLALSVIVTGVIFLAFLLYVWLAVRENLSDAHLETRGKAEVLVATTARSDLGAPITRPGASANADLGILKLEALDLAGRNISTFSLGQRAFEGPPLDPDLLEQALASPVSRTLRFRGGVARPDVISTMDVINGGIFGEEHIIAVPALFPDRAGYLRVIALYPGLSADARGVAKDAAIAATLGLAVILGAMWPFLKRFVSRPLFGYSKLAMEMAVGERVRMPAEGAGELGELGRAVNSMADALQYQATVDALTGLFNLRHLSSNLEALISQASSKGQPLSLIVGDLDDFKQVNDAHGHQAGDRVLRAVGNAIRLWAGAEYTCWRLGGDEFVVALPNVTEAEGLALAADLRKKVRGLMVAVADTLVRPSISVGVASFPMDETTGGALIGIADSRMYAAKASEAQERKLTSAPMSDAA
jgi:diguanylate cyclase (GGDEF)-like protein